MALIRLQKHIADLGFCSRRKAEKLITAGKVKVNNKTINILGTKVDPQKDIVKVDLEKNKLPQAKGKIYIALNKPIGYITSSSDKQGESVLSLLTEKNCVGKNKQKLTARVYPVGRLDKDSHGLVLLTNDGELTNLLTHPRYEHEKEYEVTIDKSLTKPAKKVLQTGMKLDDEFLQGIKITKEFNQGKRTLITLILQEGKNRQLRRMFGRLGYHVSSLRRTRIAKLKLGTLPTGRWRLVTKDKIVL